jgi:hypothetical protein
MLPLERFDEPPQRPGYQCTYRGRRNADHLRNFLVLEPFLSHQEQLPIALRQLRQDPADPLDPLRPFYIFVRESCRLDQGRRIREQTLPSLGLSGPVPDQVHRNREQPGANLGFWQILPQQPYKRLLCHIFGSVGVAREPVEITVQRWIQSLEQSVEFH